MLFRGISSRKKRPPVERRTTPDLQAIQGTWETVASIEKGKTYKLPPIVTFVFEGDKIATFLEGKEEHKGTVKLNTATDPPTIELDLKGEALGNEDQYTFGIYKLEDDKLTICAGVESAANKRPTTFAYSKAFPTASTILKRQSPVKAELALNRLKELGANPATLRQIGIQQGWKGAADDLSLINELLELIYLYLNMEDAVGADGLSQIRLKQPLEHLVLDAITDGTLRNARRVPLVRICTFFVAD